MSLIGQTRLNVVSSASIATTAFLCGLVDGTITARTAFYPWIGSMAFMFRLTGNAAADTTVNSHFKLEYANCLGKLAGLVAQ